MVKDGKIYFFPDFLSKYSMEEIMNSFTPCPDLGLADLLQFLFHCLPSSCGLEPVPYDCDDRTFRCITEKYQLSNCNI